MQQQHIYTRTHKFNTIELAHSEAHSWHIRAHSGTFEAHSSLQRQDRLLKPYQHIEPGRWAADAGGTFAATASTFIIIKGSSGAEAKPMAMDAEPMVMAAAQRVLECYCPLWAFRRVFKSKEDFRPCLLQTGAKVSLDLATRFKALGPAFAEASAAPAPVTSSQRARRAAFASPKKSRACSFRNTVPGPLVCVLFSS